GPPAPALLLDRDGQPVAAVTSTVEPGLLAEACAAALPELEAAQLRAALQTRITELSESRARLSAATQHERRRLERDLHDGAQQRLLAVLFVLESVQRRSGEEARTLVTEALDQTRVALAELRDLAHGLRPTGLHHGGLLEAVEGLIARSPGEVALRITGSLPALAEDVETTAYYVVSEALSNVAKHAEARHTEVCVHAAAATLRVAVRDDGRGGADPAGTGLRGLADRTESAGGTLLVIDLPSGGTEIRAELPCGS
ncbi:MAG: hypothetical protein QOF53_2516, partial [Nocardioidaceae bacterium]|nr:hypothetical protein [Nocardioidaceae bacterium]